MKKYLTSKTVLLLILITLFGAVLRVYRFEETLLFDADQSRDAYFAKDVLDLGPGYLPLLGAKAGDRIELEDDKGNSSDNRTVRLGPVYYYMQMVPTWLAQKADPVLLALPDLLLSIAAIPLFYLLLRQYFSKRISLWVTALFASSFFLVQYSRFAWNTNSLIFWESLLAIALLKIVKEENRKKAGIWLVVLFATYAIISQLHMIALLSFPVVIGLFWFFYRPTKISWKYWLASFAVLFVLYLPLIAAELENGGDNLQRFIAQFQVEDARVKEQSQQQRGPIAYSLIQAGKMYTLSLTSLSQAEAGDFVKCVGIVFIGGSLLLLVYSVAKKQRNYHWVPKKHPLLVLSLIWFLVLAPIYLQIAFRLDKPRYWLIGGVLPFLFLALWLTVLKKLSVPKLLTDKKFSFAVGMVMVVLIIFQLTALMNFFYSLEEGKESRFAHRDIPLNVHGNLAMLGQMKRSVDYMAQIAAQSNKSICFYQDEYQQRDSYEYLINYYYPEVKGKRLSLDEDNTQVCEFFLLYLGDNKEPEKLAKKIRSEFTVLGMRKDKATTVLHVELASLKNNTTTEARVEHAPKQSGRAFYVRDLWR